MMVSTKKVEFMLKKNELPIESCAKFSIRKVLYNLEVYVKLDDDLCLLIQVVTF